MKTPVQIHQRQQEFLDRYNPNRSVDIALTSGLKTATQHNDLYSPDANRTIIKEHWKLLLQDMGVKYRIEQKECVFFNDIIQLKNIMNNQFCCSFKNKRGRYEQGFRISHAQKSLSVYLKHLWCMGMIATPPFCPIDRVILSRVNASDPRWCHVNTIDLYQMQVASIMNGKNANHLYDGDSIAVWELFEF